MDADDARPIRYALITPAVFLSLAVGVLSVVGMTGPLGGFGDALLVYYPLLAFPLSLIPFLAPKIGVLFFCLFILIHWLVMFLISLPHLDINPFDTIPDDLLIGAAIFFLLSLPFSNTKRSVEGATT